MRAFIDTSYYIARVMPRDQWHVTALRAIRPGMSFVTSTLVINETVSLLQARGLYSDAIAFLQAVRGTADVLVICPDIQLQFEGWDLFARWGGRGERTRWIV